MVPMLLLPASSLISSGPVAYYSPDYDRADWHAIYGRQASWGNAVGPAAGYGEYWCTHAFYDNVGVRLSVRSGDQTFTCVTGDTVQDRHKSTWLAKWGLEVSWDFFQVLPDPGYVEVYNAQEAPKAQVTAPSIPEVVTFPETDHSLTGRFLNFWRMNGGVSIFGFPISGEESCAFENGDTGTCQYFERARFELHGDTVKLGRLGAELCDDAIN